MRHSGLGHSGFRATAVVLGAAVFGMMSNAHAQSTGPAPTGPAPAKDLRGEIGIGIAAVPNYEGSDDYEYIPILIGRATWKNIVWVEGNDRRVGREFASVGAHIFKRPNFRAGPMVQYRGPRDMDDNKQLDGLGDVDVAIEIGLYGEAKFNNVLLRAEGVQDVNEGHEGFVLDLSAEYEFHPIAKLRASVGLSSTWASDSYMQAFFSISDAQLDDLTEAAEVRNEAPKITSAFTAESGFTELGINAKATYDVTASVGVTGTVAYRRMLQDAAESPLVSILGDPNQYYVGAGVTYRF